MNNACTNLFFLSSLACKLSECLSADELSVLAADLVALSDMINAILARQGPCGD